MEQVFCKIIRQISPYSLRINCNTMYRFFKSLRQIFFNIPGHGNGSGERFFSPLFSGRKILSGLPVIPFLPFPQGGFLHKNERTGRRNGEGVQKIQKIPGFSFRTQGFSFFTAGSMGMKVGENSVCKTMLQSFRDSFFPPSTRLQSERELSLAPMTRTVSAASAHFSVKASAASREGKNG